MKTQKVAQCAYTSEVVLKSRETPAPSKYKLDYKLVEPRTPYYHMGEMVKTVKSKKSSMSPASTKYKVEKIDERKWLSTKKKSAVFTIPSPNNVTISKKPSVQNIGPGPQKYYVSMQQITKSCSKSTLLMS